MTDDRTNKNQVFNQSPSPGGIPQISTTEVLRTKFGLDIPTEVVPLPSNGLVYDVESPLYRSETIDIHPMTAREEDILTNQALLKKGTVLNELCRSCLVDKRINPLDLVLGDRNALMVAIRITGYGAEYDADLTCSSCSEKYTFTFDLSQLPIRRLELTPVSEGTNLFPFKLLKSNKTVKFRFLTGKDEQDISTTQERQKKANLAIAGNITTNLVYCISEIDNNSNKNDIKQFVEHMPAMDSRDLRNYMRENEPGVIMKQEAECSHCGYSEEVGLPFGAQFFWPQSNR